MKEEKLKAIITEVLLRKVKFIGEDEQTYYGCPAELIDELLSALKEYEVKEG